MCASLSTGVGQQITPPHYDWCMYVVRVRYLYHIIGLLNRFQSLGRRVVWLSHPTDPTNSAHRPYEIMWDVHMRNKDCGTLVAY